MPTSEARRSPRIAFHAAVELLAKTGDDESPREIAAAALDLGSGGMRVEVAERMPIGAPITCRINLDGRTTDLSGRVVWMRAHTAPRPHGMGIRFDAVPGYEQRLLSHVVERSSEGYRPVQLRFEGTDAPIVARALPHASGVTLSSPLPILDRGSSVDVQLDADGPTLDGRVDDVRVVEVDARRRLEIEIALRDADGARFRREARFVEAGVPEGLRLADADRAPLARPARSGSSLGAALRALLLLATGVVIGLALAPRLAQPFAGLWAAAFAPQAQLDARPPATRAAAISTAPLAAASVASDAPPSRPVEASAPATVTAVDPATAAAPRTSDAPPRAPAARGAEATTPVAATAATAPPPPSVTVEGRTTVLRLPFSGTLEGMVSRTWADPAALALDLPGGQSQLAAGSHALHGGCVAGLRINTRGGASLLRVKLFEPIARYTVSMHDGVLELRLTRHAASE